MEANGCTKRPGPRPLHCACPTRRARVEVQRLARADDAPASRAGKKPTPAKPIGPCGWRPPRQTWN
eukprot:4403698-Lingulodinium_polyedra.AAC.1